MSGFAGILGAFAGGYGRALQQKKDKAERDALGARMDSYISAMERMPQPMNFGVTDQPMGAAAMGATGGFGAAAAPMAGGQEASLLSLVDKTEGGGNYDTLFGHSQNGGRFNGMRVTEKTLAELYDFANPSGEYGQWVKGSVGRVATPMGRYQIVGSTLRRAAEGMGLSPDTKFTPQTQDAIAAYLARNRLAKAKSPEQKRIALRSEWEGFKNVADADLDAAIAKFEANGGVLTSRPLGVGPM